MSNVLKGIAQGLTQEDLKPSAEEQARNFFGKLDYGQWFRIVWEPAETSYIDNMRTDSFDLVVENISAKFTATKEYSA